MNEIDQLTRQLELKKANMETARLFDKNMKFLGQAAPDLQQEYRSYQPARLRLTFSQAGYLNVADTKLGNREIYPKEPVAFYRELVRHYRKKPEFYRMDLVPRKEGVLEKEPHVWHIDNIARYLHEKVPVEPIHGLPKRVDMLVILGVGLGHHIDELTQKHDIRHLFIIEPDKDWFHASLHTVDWEAINRRFSKEGYSLNLQIAQPHEQVTTMLKNHITAVGNHNAAVTYLLNHVKSEELASATQNLLGRITSLLSSLGYFDDERIGLAHTLKNFSNKTPCLVNHSKISKKLMDTPAFILGNGPSLDSAIEFLKEHRSEAILISCGTTLGSLEKAGIKPDIHIEQERPRQVCEWLSFSTSDSFRKDILMIGLNTVHPEVFSLFKKTAMFMKPNDLGSLYSAKMVKSGAHIIQLPYCNPTVTNAGLALAAAIGFKDIYLFGVDYGYPSKNAHHSKHAVYYNVKKEFNEAVNPSNENQKYRYEVKGNFQDSIETTAVLLRSKQSAEDLIRDFSYLNYYNTSNGALIEGAAPIKLENIGSGRKIPDKQLLIERIVNENFSTDTLTQIDNSKNVRALADTVRPILGFAQKTLSKTPSSIEEALKQVDTIQKRVNRQGSDSINERAALQLIRGSINSFNAALKVSLLRSSDPEASLSAFRYASGEYQEFLKSAMKRLDNNFLEADQRRANLAEKFH